MKLPAPEKQNREEEQKLALLHSLAAEGFDALDQGRGTIVDNPRELGELIGRIGRRAAREV